jgi:hypothetical protein
VAFLLEHRAVYTGPIRIAWQRLAGSRPQRAPAEPEPRFIPVRGMPGMSISPPLLPGAWAAESERSLVARGVAFLARRLRAQPLAGTYEQMAASIEPQAPGWVVEMYEVLTRTGPTGDLTRRSFEALFRPGGTALWRKYIGGDGSGRHSGRGILDIWGCIAQTGPRGSWQYCQPLQVILELDPELRRYAERKADLVQHRHESSRWHSPAVIGAGQSARNGVLPNQTEPENQTKDQRA